MLKEDRSKQENWKLKEPSQEAVKSWNELKHDRLKLWVKAAADFDESRTFAAIVCGRETVVIINDLAAFVNRLAVQMTENPDSYDSQSDELFEKIATVRDAIRKELEVDA